MKEKLIREVQHGLLGVLDQRQQEMLKSVLLRCLDGYTLTEEIKQEDNSNNYRYLDMFVSAKRVEGCSEKTVDYYTATIKRLLDTVKKDIRDIMTDDIRTYLSEYQEQHGSSKVTMDNMRRIFSSFFSWLEDEDYIVKSPVRRIHKVKTTKVIKETFTDENMEVLRDTCSEIRNLAMIELLASAGIRVGELVLLNRADIDFNERSCIVFVFICRIAKSFKQLNAIFISLLFGKDFKSISVQFHFNFLVRFHFVLPLTTPRTLFLRNSGFPGKKFKNF